MTGEDVGHQSGEKAVQDYIRKVELGTLDLMHRTAFLIDIQKELNRYNRTGHLNRAIGVSPMIYRMVVWAYDMVVIDFASLCAGVTEAGGMFGSLGKDLHALKR